MDREIGRSGGVDGVGRRISQVYFPTILKVQGCFSSSPQVVFRAELSLRVALSSSSFKLIYLPRQNGAQARLCHATPPVARTDPASVFELANQFNRAVGCSEKIIGAGRLFKVRGPRIGSDSQLQVGESGYFSFFYRELEDVRKITRVANVLRGPSVRKNEVVCDSLHTKNGLCSTEKKNIPSVWIKS